MDQRAKTILIVDDSELVLRSMAELFDLEGYFVHTAKDGQEALKKMEELTVDVILLDCRLPGMEGPEVAERIRGGTGPEKSTPIIGMSIDNPRRREKECLKAGMNRFVDKSSGPDKIIEEVNRAVSAIQ
ncbi:MAG: response regulator [Candidatus Omnitrophica bacterium]|nr:response regulator [Candidatus Omnitrophota bacterium]MCA9425432.1 response regulator [Candidatus Omnitrophota bacterium]MCA9430688.1 response regulator [Candidatus Omnitrophota bacterium]MCA9435325.1 response regulator [Candidatus Omnitrophota bacterium]MCA9442284.1 response regulator [Candidatus Omnitrophota bacterium]